MPNEFSVQIHDFLSAKRQHLLNQKSNDKTTEVEFINGQLQEIDWLRDYLKVNFDLKDFRYYSE